MDDSNTTGFWEVDVRDRSDLLSCPEYLNFSVKFLAVRAAVWNCYGRQPRLLNLTGREVVAIFSGTACRYPFDCTRTANGCLTQRSQNANRHVGDSGQSNTGDPKLLAGVFQSPLIKWSHPKRLHQSEVTVMHFALNTEHARVQKTSVFPFHTP